ncbi:MAG: class I SAM-dependent methyltransferase [Anaerolineales bacterium]|jgi:2-polyprenyl-3-methyl-5-hydroxy-6-metoxy-1,4-benzoquinol methylase|nr:class I SAM-dependent methyltransferase [Chloroflexota bacterium]MBK6645687.1 class I SAM-dependent methyltransferase [Anaerolineales bacterium]MCC6987264.1 class I SAM-dependent methyltransferase [Anaerolineales bacterium]
MTNTASSLNLEPASCPICGPDAPSVVRYDFAPHKVVVCSSCGLTYLSPRLTESAILELYKDEAYYNSNISGQGYDEYMEISDNWVKTFTLRLKQIAPYKSTGKALDIGCGPGYFLTAAQKLGFDVHGLDPSDYIVTQAQKTWGDRVRLGLIESAGYEPESFDLIVAFDTFEHIYEPKQFLAAIQRVLKTGGVLAITTPDPTSLLSKISGKNWVSFKLPEHVFYWSPGTIRKILGEHFEVLEVRRAGQYATLGFLFRRLFRLGNNPGRFLNGLIGILNKFSIYSDNGSITAIARKTSP